MDGDVLQVPIAETCSVLCRVSPWADRLKDLHPSQYCHLKIDWSKLYQIRMQKYNIMYLCDR